jgi:NRPS condensation-like uncharacterized protein
MIDNPKVKPYERKITPLERWLIRAPYAIVTVVARIKGTLAESMLRIAVVKMQQRHALLRVRIKEDEEHEQWFTSEGVDAIPIEIVPRQSDYQWVDVQKKASKIPFEFNTRPAIRFILVQSPTICELLIMCHHIICDGMSLAYLARDLMITLSEPNWEVDVLPDPVPIDQDNFPPEITVNILTRFFIDRINQQWQAEPIFFDQEDYEALNEAYWRHFTHHMLSVELSEAQTSDLVARCRKENVTVNSALTTAFTGAQTLVRGNKAAHPRIGVAANIRDRLPKPAGEAMGFYAGLVGLNYRYKQKLDFWENVRNFHRKVKPLYINTNIFKETLVWCHLAPGILESFCFKMLGSLVSPDSTRYDKLSTFSQRADVITSILKREKMDSLENTLMGTAITNLTRMDFPQKYGTLVLDRLILHPGGGYPLAMVTVVLGIVTCCGKLSLVIEYAEEAVTTGTMEKIKDTAMAFLFSGT